MVTEDLCKETEDVTPKPSNEQVAEYLYFGEASNGAPCYQQLDTCMLMSQDAMSGEKMQGQVTSPSLFQVASPSRSGYGALCSEAGPF